MAARIYADFNGLFSREAAGTSVALDTMGTLRELSTAGIALSDGMSLLVYDWSDDEEDLEADVVARFDQERGIWWGDIAPDGVRYVPKKERGTRRVFLCIKCRAPLDEHIRKSGLKFGDRCPSCATPIHAAIAPHGTK